MRIQRSAAHAFLASVDTEAGRPFRFPIDAREWRLWANNTRPIMRHGLLFEEMTPPQRVTYEGLRELAREASKHKKRGATSDHSDMYDEYGLPI